MNHELAKTVRTACVTLAVLGVCIAASRTVDGLAKAASTFRPEITVRTVLDLTPLAKTVRGDRSTSTQVSRTK